MKIIEVFYKNFRIVSRSPVFFVSLVLLPLLLIFSMGILFNSSDWQKITMGVVGNSAIENWEVSHITFSNLHDCELALSKSQVNFCVVKSNNSDEETFYSIYYDNFKSLVSASIREKVLNIFLKKQSSELDQVSNQIDDKVQASKSSINLIISKLNSAKDNLESQKNSLQDYSNKLSEFQNYFDSFYSSYQNSKSDLDSTKVDLNNLLNQIDSLSYLNSSVPPQALYELSLVKNSLEKVRGDLDTIYSENTSQNLDTFKSNLQNLKNELDNAIQNTDMAISEINSLQEILSSTKNNLSELSQNDMSNSNVLFFEAFASKGSEIFSYFPLIVDLIICFTSVILSNLFILKLYSSKSCSREFVSPVSDFNFILGDFLICLSFISLESLVLFFMGVSFKFYSVTIIYSYFLIILPFASLFILVGMILGYLIRSNILSMLVSIFFALFVFIFSDLFIPFIFLKNNLQFFVLLNPFYLFRLCLDRLIIYQIPISQNILILIGIFILILFGASFFAKKVNRNNFFD